MSNQGDGDNGDDKNDEGRKQEKGTLYEWEQGNTQEAIWLRRRRM